MVINNMRFTGSIQSAEQSGFINAGHGNSYERSAA